MNKWILCILLLNFSATACQKRSGDAEYAKRQYLDQQYEKDSLQEPSQNEPMGEDFLIQAQITKHPEWRRKDYETLKEWQERMLALLEDNARRIEEKQLELRNLGLSIDEETALIQQLIARNNALNEQIGEFQQVQDDTPFEALTSLPPPPFKIHLVKKGETLHGITMHYYNDEEKVLDVMRWNRAWIRHTEELIAGIGLVLFPEHVQNPSPEIVDDYMERVLEQQEHRR